MYKKLLRLDHRYFGNIDQNIGINAVFGELAVSVVLQWPRFLTWPLDLYVHRPSVLMAYQIRGAIQSRLYQLVYQPPLAS
jgi:hypothetical protein